MWIVFISLCGFYFSGVCQGFTELGCYNDLCFTLSDQTRKWNPANNVCENNGGSLAKITNNEIKLYLQDNVTPEMDVDVLWSAGYSGLEDWHWTLDGESTWHQGCYLKPAGLNGTKILSLQSNSYVNDCLNSCNSAVPYAHLYQEGQKQNKDVFCKCMVTSSLQLKDGCEKCPNNVDYCGSAGKMDIYKLGGTSFFNKITAPESNDCAFLQSSDGKWITKQCKTQYPSVCQYNIDECDSNMEDKYLVSSSLCISVERVADTWPQANAQCQTNGGDLVKISSLNENIGLKDFLLDNNNNDPQRYWIGLTRLEWKWKMNDENDMRIQNFVDWSANGEPNIAVEESCIALKTQNDYEWDDRQCDEEFRFICETEGPSQTQSTATTTPLPPPTTTELSSGNDQNMGSADDNMQPLPPDNPPPNNPPGEEGQTDENSTLAIALGVTSGLVVLLAVIIGIMLYCRHKKNKGAGNIPDQKSIAKSTKNGDANDYEDLNNYNATNRAYEGLDTSEEKVRSAVNMPLPSSPAPNDYGLSYYESIKATPEQNRYGYIIMDKERQRGPKGVDMNRQQSEQSYVQPYSSSSNPINGANTVVPIGQNLKNGNKNPSYINEGSAHPPKDKSTQDPSYVNEQKEQRKSEGYIHSDKVAQGSSLNAAVPPPSGNDVNNSTNDKQTLPQDGDAYLEITG